MLKKPWFKNLVYAILAALFGTAGATYLPDYMEGVAREQAQEVVKEYSEVGAPLREAPENPEPGPGRLVKGWEWMFWVLVEEKNPAPNPSPPERFMIISDDSYWLADGEEPDTGYILKRMGEKIPERYKSIKTGAIKSYVVYRRVKDQTGEAPTPGDGGEIK